VESAILEDEEGRVTEKAVMITAEKLFVINFKEDIIEV
jgi:hypothetical protein